MDEKTKQKIAKILRAVLGVLAAILVIVAVSSVTAGGGEPATLQETLAFIAVGGTALGALVSQVLEDFEFFQNLSGQWRSIVIKLFTLGLPSLAAALLPIIPILPPPFDQAWALAVTAVLMFLGSQVWHVAINKRRTGAADLDRPIKWGEIEERIHTMQ